MFKTPLTLVAGCLLVVGVSGSTLEAGEAAIQTVVETEGLVAFWTFGEAENDSRRSSGTRHEHPLAEVHGPIRRVAGGPYSGHSVELNGKQYFRIPHAELKDLNISGPNAEVSMFAVVWITDVVKSRTIAGIWSEGKGAHDDTGTRQYAMLLHKTRWSHQPPAENHRLQPALE